MKKFIKENGKEITQVLSVIGISLLIIFSVSIIDRFLIKDGKGWVVDAILVFAIFWIIWLYISKGEIKTRYELFKKFSFKFYSEVKKKEAIKDCGYDHGDYTPLEDEFEEWLRNDIKI